MSLRTSWACSALLTFAGTTALAQPQGYMNNKQLSKRLELIALDEHAQLTQIGESLNGNPIHMLTLSTGSGTSPGLLIVAGIDGMYLSSTELAIRISEQILKDHISQLDGMDIYIVPRANPDGAAMNMGQVLSGSQGNGRVVDEDRDRLSDEDGPDDLNNDGYITMMRRLNPTLDDAPTHTADPDDPRVNIEPDVSEGQRATFTLYPEGIDNDEDGEINEDGFGTVDINMNFMHRWPEHQPHAGRFPLSEPEAYALARFVLDHDNIIAALTIGKHDNLVNQPDSKKKDINKRSPLEIHEDDAELYKEVGEWFTDATGHSVATKHDSAGSFAAWMYAQRGLPSFAIQPWARPDTQKSTEDKADESVAVEQEGNGLTPSPVGDISMETLDELREAYTAMTGEEPDESMLNQITPEMVEQFASQAGIEIRRVTQANQTESSEEANNSKTDKKLSDDAKWLNYFDEADIDGFVDWEPFDHPTLGKVEIGGFKPGARVNPPADQLDEIAAEHTEFVLKLLDARPRIEILTPEVVDLGGGLYEVRLTIVNDGDLPTTTKFARTTRSIKPTIISLSVDVDRIINGQRIGRIWGIDHDGGRSEHRWIFRTDDINNETVTINDPRNGTTIVELGEQ